MKKKSLLKITCVLLFFACLKSRAANEPVYMLSYQQIEALGVNGYKNPDHFPFTYAFLLEGPMWSAVPVIGKIDGSASQIYDPDGRLLFQRLVRSVGPPAGTYNSIQEFRQFLEGPPNNLSSMGVLASNDGSPWLTVGDPVYQLPNSILVQFGVSYPMVVIAEDGPPGMNAFSYFLVAFVGSSGTYVPLNMPEGPINTDPNFYDASNNPLPESSVQNYLSTVLGLSEVGVLEPSSSSVPAPGMESGPASMPPQQGNDPSGPTVHNVQVSPQPDGTYQVDYTIDPMPGEIFYVEAYFSTDGGNQWSEINSVDHSMGPPAFGSDASYGGGIHNFRWDAAMDAPGISVPDARVRVVATAGNVPGGFHGPGIFMGGPTEPGGPSVPGAGSAPTSYKVYEMSWDQFNYFVPGGGAVQANQFPAYVYFETNPGGNWFLKNILRGDGPDGIPMTGDDDYYNGPGTFMEPIDSNALVNVAPASAHSDEERMRNDFESFLTLPAFPFGPLSSIGTANP